MKVMLMFEQARGGRDLALAHHLVSSGVQPLLLYQNGSPKIAIQQAKGVHAIGLPFSSRFDVKSIMQLKAIFCDHKPQVVHAHSARLAWIFIMSQWPKKSTRLILHRGAIRKLNPLSPSDRLLFFGRWVDVFDCNASAVGASLIDDGVAKEKVIVTYLGVEQDSLGVAASYTFPVLPTARTPKIRIGTIANYRKIKGLEYLIDAADILSDSDLDFELHIVGMDSDGRLRDYVSKARSASRIRLVGFLERPWTLLSGFDCLVIPSLSEGLPQVAVEALACQVPVVATNVGGLGEVISADHNGLLVSPRNPQQLASAIRCIVTNRGEANKFRVNGLRTFHEKFSMDVMCRGLTTLYLGLSK